MKGSSKRRIPVLRPGPGNAGIISERILVIILTALLIISSSCGCVRLVQKSVPVSDAANARNLSANTGRTPDMEQQQLTGKMTITATAARAKQTVIPILTPALVSETDPILPEDSYPIQHASRISAADNTARLLRIPEFVRTYTLRGNATGLLVNVTKGPLIIGFAINPVYDCIEDPDSCRGTLNSVSRPYCTITVRDNETRVVVVQDGYAREYSSQNSDRSITVFGEGRYHVTNEGNFLEVTLSITTGSSPYSKDTAISSPPTTQSRAEYERMIRQRQGA